jgi:hypothetical protein
MKRTLFLIVIFIGVTGSLFAQLSLTNAAPTATIDFSANMQVSVGTSPGTPYAGAGFALNPSGATLPGRLNSNAWETRGWTFGSLLFGANMSNPAHGRGSVAGAAVTEGIYAFTDNPASVENPTLMIQPAAGDFSPGSLTLRIRNNGTQSMTQLQVSYNLFVRNDQNSSSSFNFSHSHDNVVFVDEPTMDYVSPSTSDDFQWVKIDGEPSRMMVITGINVVPGGFYYIRWSGADVVVAGARDEFGLDDITCTAFYGAPAPEINVTGNTKTILSGDMSPEVADGTLFPNTFTGGSISYISYLIQNLGGADLNISGITITGVNPGDFSIHGASPLGIVPGVSGSTISSVTLTLKFIPLAAGERSAIINIANNDNTGNENPYRFMVMGTGVIPQPDIDLVGNTSPNTSPIFTGSMIPSVNNCTLFDPQPLGGAGQTKSYRIRNTGQGANLILTGAAPYITIAGAHPQDFTLVVSPTNNSISPGFSQTFSIRFNPSAQGIRNAIVSIANNDVIADAFGNLENPFTFLIQGNGISPEIDVTGNGQPISSGSTNPTLANHTQFDYVNVSAGSVTRTFSINNIGSMPLVISSVTLSGSSDFTLISSPASSIPINGTSSFTVQFDPSTIGPHEAMVTIVNNDLDENPYTFKISGFGTDFIPCSYDPVQILAQQDFEVTPASPSWSYATTGTTSLTTGTGHGSSSDGGTSPRFIGGRAIQVSNSTATITFGSVSTIDYFNIELNLRVASMSTTSSEGNDATDKVVVAISKDNGATWSNEIEVKGSTNSKWSFTSGAAVASVVYDANNIVSSQGPTALGYVTDQGYSTISITNLPQTANLRVRLTVNNNSSSEIWAIDNVALFGRKEVSTTWNGSSWSNNAPTASVKAVIEGNYNTTVHGNFQACKCQIKPGSTVTIQPNQHISVESDLLIQGALVVENSGSLVQRNDFAMNSGIVTVKRHTTPMTRYDYTYWSAPVLAQTLYNLSPLTLSDKYFTFNSAGNVWQNLASSTAMLPGRGYIIRAPQTFSTTAPSPYLDGQFVGSPNNGFINPSIVGGGAWNLIGNPYPSAINADVFLGSPLNTGVVGGTIYLWTHNTPIANNQYSAADYAVYNLLGGVGTAAAQLPGVNNTIPTGAIASGQGFFIGGTANGNATFTNNMRLLGSNATFFRSAGTNDQLPNQNSHLIERHRLWLNLSNNQGAFKQTLIGYVSGATNGLDRDFDGSTLASGTAVSLYSIVDDAQLAIQGRQLPFNVQDLVPLGFRASSAGSYLLSIEKGDGLFENQAVYLEDRLLNIVHNLKLTPYDFVCEGGINNSRFVLRFTPETQLEVPNHELQPQLTVASHEQVLYLQASENIDSVQVYDLSGRLIYSGKGYADNIVAITQLQGVSRQSLIIRAKLAGGRIITRKAII